MHPKRRSIKTALKGTARERGFLPKNQPSPFDSLSRGSDLVDVAHHYGMPPNVLKQAVKEGWGRGIILAINGGFAREMVLAMKVGLGREMAQIVSSKEPLSEKQKKWSLY